MDRVVGTGGVASPIRPDQIRLMRGVGGEGAGIRTCTCTIVVGHLKGTATVYEPHIPRQCFSSQGTCRATVLKTVKQLAGTI